LMIRRLRSNVTEKSAPRIPAISTRTTYALSVAYMSVGGRQTCGWLIPASLSQAPEPRQYCRTSEVGQSDLSVDLSPCRRKSVQVIDRFFLILHDSTTWLHLRYASPRGDFVSRRTYCRIDIEQGDDVVECRWAWRTLWTRLLF
jgi:hypothetical protein